MVVLYLILTTGIGITAFENALPGAVGERIDCLAQSRALRQLSASVTAKTDLRPVCSAWLEYVHLGDCFECHRHRAEAGWGDSIVCRRRRRDDRGFAMCVVHVQHHVAFRGMNHVPHKPLLAGVQDQLHSGATAVSPNLALEPRSEVLRIKHYQQPPWDYGCPRPTNALRRLPPADQIVAR